jgi:hypothetical protein
MVNNHGGPGTDAPLTRARARLSHSSQAHTPATTPEDSEPNGDRAATPSSQSPPPPPTVTVSDSSASEPPARQRSEAFLDDTNPRKALPVFWRGLLPNAHSELVQRMYVRGDGSCAKGAVLLAYQTVEDLRDSRTLSAIMAQDASQKPFVHPPTSIQSFVNDVLLV